MMRNVHLGGPCRRELEEIIAGIDNGLRVEDLSAAQALELGLVAGLVLNPAVQQRNAGDGSMRKTTAAIDPHGLALTDSCGLSPAQKRAQSPVKM